MLMLELESRRERLCRESGRRVMLMRRLEGRSLISCALCVHSLAGGRGLSKKEATAQPTLSNTVNAPSRQHHTLQDLRRK